MKKNLANSQLLVAVKNADEKQINKYLSAGADINTSNSNGKKVVHIAGKIKELEKAQKITAMLLDNFADVDAFDNEDKTAVFIALENRRYDVAGMFIQFGADVYKEQTKNQDLTPMDLIYDIEDSSAQQRLLELVGQMRKEKSRPYLAKDDDNQFNQSYHSL